MSVNHHIDDNAKLITTSMNGNAIDGELVEQLTNYLKDIKSQPDYISYNEILDLRGIDGFKVDAHGIRELAKISSSYDSKDVKTKLAIIASSILAFGFSKIYEMARRLNPRSMKEVRIFKNSSDALSWLESENKSDNASTN